MYNFLKMSVLFLAIFLSPITAVSHVAEARSPEVVVVDAYNPYGVVVRVNLKCDWSNKTKQFTYNKHYVLQPRSVVRMLIPSNVRKCQIWPKADIF